MYYTYAHYTPEGEIFYIGKGCGDRAFSFNDRSRKWKAVVKKYMGLSIQIIAEWRTEEEALEHEVVLIACFKDMGKDLINLTDGGRGVVGYLQPEELREKKRQLMTGYKHQEIKCPKCGKSGGETAMKRWHFDKCTGTHAFKARATLNGKRVYLGTYSTKEQAKAKVEDFYKEQQCQ